MKAVIYQDDGKRARTLTNAFMRASLMAGFHAELKSAQAYNGSVSGDIAIFYGLRNKLLSVYNDYIDAGKHTVLIDLGYWGRTDGGRLSGFHKCVFDGLHPNHYVNKSKFNKDRFAYFGIKPKPARTGDYVLLAGMSEKAAWVYGLKPLEFETMAIHEIRKHTDRPIIYRPKPSWKGALPIQGTIYSPPEELLISVLRKSCAVVTHHSNVSIDALIDGIPAICMADSAASAVCDFKISEIDNLPMIDTEVRDQFLANLAYTQWNVGEIRQGLPLNYFKSIGLL